ncbi:MAG: DUF4251 domain-containing protein [Tannerellaceae bacterium]
MKVVRLLGLVGIAFLMGGQSLFAQAKQQKEEKKARQEQMVKEQIENGRFKVDVDRAMPMQGRPVNLTSSYSLEVRGDSVISYLPYFGRAYSAPYGGGDGMRFEALLTDYSCTYAKKGVAQIKFRTKTKEDTYDFRMQIYPNGSSTLNVTPVNKQAISYTGELKTKEAE